MANAGHHTSSSSSSLLSNATVEFLRAAFAREYELREALVQRLLWQHRRIPNKRKEGKEEVEEEEFEGNHA